MSAENTNSTQQKPDPNTLWKSPYGTTENVFDMSSVAAGDELNGLEEVLLENNGKEKDPVTLVKSLVATVTKFWRKHNVGFVEFWHTLTPKSRENFLWTAYPTLPYSFEERYCVDEGVKVNAHQYDRHLLLNSFSHLTLTDLIEGDSFIDLVKDCAEPSFLKSAGSKAAIDIRRLHQNGLYPFSLEERIKYNRELNLQKGDIVVSLVQEDGFGVLLTCMDPKSMVNGMGGVTPDGQPVLLYHWGLFHHPTEFNLFMACLYLQLSLLTNAIDEYKEKILGRESSDILMNSLKFCANCDSDETKLLMCSGCKLAFYCSKECQVAHWKSEHKVKCKEHIQSMNNLRSNNAAGESKDNGV